jgi:hypothetical protein
VQSKGGRKIYRRRQGEEGKERERKREKERERENR